MAEIPRLEQLEDENGQLKRLVVDLAPEVSPIIARLLADFGVRPDVPEHSRDEGQ